MMLVLTDVFHVAVCIAADFFFAAFPWLFIWKLNMKHKEKVTIAASMSVGVV